MDFEFSEKREEFIDFLIDLQNYNLSSKIVNEKPKLIIKEQCGVCFKKTDDLEFVFCSQC